MMRYPKFYSSYSRLRNTIDKVSDTLTGKHSSHMMCSKGCDLCCMDYSILPVEFHFILEQLKNQGYKKEVPVGEKEGCIFLNNHSCSIYNDRPLICRTHGLPLLYTNDDYEWELSTCELNFRQFNYEEFTPENTFAQDKYNSRLFMLNREFITEYNQKQYGEYERVPLRKLAEQI